MAKIKEEDSIYSRLAFPATIVGVMWLIRIIEVMRGEKFTTWGIYPREWSGLWGILTSPFIHGDWQHLFSNSLPMIILLSMLMVFYRRVAIPTFFIIVIFTGVTVWLFARESYHVGASGVVYGLVAFLAWTGIFRRNLKSVVIALAIVVLYGGYFHGIVPTKEGVSFESHLFGGLVGIFTAFLFKNVKEPDEKAKEEEMEMEQRDYYFPSDVFEKTKMQRYLESLREEE